MDNNQYYKDLYENLIDIKFSLKELSSLYKSLKMQANNLLLINGKIVSDDLYEKLKDNYEQVFEQLDSNIILKVKNNIN